MAGSETAARLHGILDGKAAGVDYDTDDLLCDLSTEFCGFPDAYAGIIITAIADRVEGEIRSYCAEEVRRAGRLFDEEDLRCKGLDPARLAEMGVDIDCLLFEMEDSFWSILDGGDYIDEALDDALRGYGLTRGDVAS